MRQLVLGQSIGQTADAKLTWLEQAMREVERASYEDDNLNDVRAGLLDGINITQTGSASFPMIETLFGLAYNRIYILNDAADAAVLPNGRQQAVGFQVEVYPNSGARGNRNAILGSTWVAPGAVVDTISGLNEYSGGLFFGKTDINLGGTNTGAGANGAVFGASSFATSGTGATNLIGVVAHEFDVLMHAGSSAKIRIGASAVDLGSAVQGASYDAAFHAGALAGSAKWKAAFLISDMNGGDPIDATIGRVIYCQGTASAGSFAEAPNYTFSDYIFNFNKFSVTGAGKTVVTSNNIHAIAIGPNGDTNPTFVVACNVASQATGIAVIGAAAGGGAGLTVIGSGTNELLAINAKGSGDLYLNNSATGAVRIGAGGLFPITDDSAALGNGSNRWSDLHLATGAVINYQNGNYTITHASGVLTTSGAFVITSSASHALAVGRQGDTDPAFAVSASTASQATGIAVVGAATGGGVGFSAISPGTNELLAINAKGSGDIYLNNSATGAVRIGNALLPKTDDAAALGSAAERWADLFLSTGGVINWNNGNFTITHAAGKLTFSGQVYGTSTKGFVINSATGDARFDSVDNTSLAADGTLDLGISSVSLVYWRDNTAGGGALVMYDGGTTRIIDQSSAGLFVTADPGSGTSKWWVQGFPNNGKITNRFAGTRSMHALILGG